MTITAALHQFFNSFAIPFYPDTNVPNDATFPYGTYNVVINGWQRGETALTINLWYRTESESVPNAKALEIYDRIGMGGVLLPCDDGAIWLKRGDPWVNNLNDDSDPMIKRRYINITAEFETVN